MNIEYLKYFSELAKIQHYGKAAKALNISQPGLSHAIKSLEEEYGVPLFQKEGRNVSLSHYGKELMKDVDEILGAYLRLEERAAGFRTEEKTVSMIVGRDTEHLTEEGVAKAAIETVAENTSDGVIAPVLYTALGGPVLGFLYKAVNTMDSMVGYKNEKYLHFGRAAAKLDDVMNFLPARISALLMVGTAFISGKSYNGKQAWRIWRRDNRKHASPNSAQTESVCAGALGIQLAGDASYFGKVVKKPYIGDPTRAVEPEDIRRTNRLMNRTAWICEILCLGILIAVVV